jgi:threonine dehydrogenase-like Zn-dependent dehydrogenase
MLAVQLNPSESDQPEIVLLEMPRPAIQSPTDVVLMVTTTAIGSWEIARARQQGGAVTPGAQFAGVVVDMGEAVKAIDIDDLVVATCTLQQPSHDLFGTGDLPGGHAEYVRVPDADQVLVKTTAGAEERTVFAGGAAAMGFAAADRALAHSSEGPVLVNGCDAAILSALAWLKHRRGKLENVFAFDHHPARLAAAKSFGAREYVSESTETSSIDVQIFGSDPNEDLFDSTGGLVATDPCAGKENRPAFEPPTWPTLEQAHRAEMAIRLRQVDLTALVSTVVPLDEAAEGYRVALETPPGIRSVLLKP